MNRESDSASFVRCGARGKEEIAFLGREAPVPFEQIAVQVIHEPIENPQQRSFARVVLSD